jgi:hypothetical protein
MKTDSKPSLLNGIGGKNGYNAKRFVEIFLDTACVSFVYFSISLTGTKQGQR